jgi:hypothetical protein
LPASSELFERVADTVADARILAPPITRISLEEAPAALNPAQARPASGKTVITGRAQPHPGRRAGSRPRPALIVRPGNEHRKPAI